MKYKVGDKVRIRKDLKLGDTYGSCIFTKEMQNLCGKIARITAVNEGHEDYRVDSSCYFWTDEMFEDRMSNNIHIHTDGNQVIAINEETGKRGVARCHPDDTFDFFVGAKLALERLEEAEKPYVWLKKGMTYYISAVVHRNLYESHKYYADTWDKRYMERGIVFKTKEEAIACAKKMLEVVKQED